MSGDRGDIVVGWLVRIVVCLTLFGVVAFDLVSVGLAHVAAQDDGNAAAAEASAAYLASANPQQAYLAAVGYAEAHGEVIRPTEFRVDPDGRVHLTLHKSATTLVLYRLGPLKQLGEVEATASVKAVPGS